MLKRKLSTDRNLIWFHLYDAHTEKPVRGSSATIVDLPCSYSFQNLRYAIRDEYFYSHLKGMDVSKFKIFKNKNAFDKRNLNEGKEEPLKSSELLDRLGETKEDALIVLAPIEESQRVNAPEWKQELPFIPSALESVNRTEAFEQLNSVHRSNYNRAESGRGADWQMPIADNLIGPEESDFVQHYIQKTKEEFEERIKNGYLDQFLKTFCAGHTIHISFSKKALVCDNFDEVMLKHLQEALQKMFVVPPQVLSNPRKDGEPYHSNKTFSFLKSLTNEVGPVFIVLNDIGEAFEDTELANYQKKDNFLRFCYAVPSYWLGMKKVFFLFAGPGSFLSDIPFDGNCCYATNRRYLFRKISI